MSAEYNDSQMAAVTAGLDRSPVILIQVNTTTLWQKGGCAVIAEAEAQ